MGNNNNIAIKLENVNKTFHIRENEHQTIRERAFSFFKKNTKREIKALQNINIEIKKGEFFGIIGRNRSGKSTLIHLMTGAYKPDKGGKVFINGKYIRLSLGMGFNQELTARQNIYINCSVLGIPIKIIDKQLKTIIQFSELQDYIDTKIKFFSKGMIARLSFAIAIHAQADIFLMDEYFGGVGDEGFRRKADRVFKKTFLTGRTIVHVSHSLETVSKYCDRVLLLNKGEILALGTPEEVIPIYKELFKPQKKDKP